MTAANFRPHRRVRQLARITLFLLTGACGSVFVAWGFAWAGNPPAGLCETAESASGKMVWTVSRRTQPGSILIESQCEPVRRRSWGTEQLLGPPDTTGSGDMATAWASSSQDGHNEWLILEYEKPVEPASVHVVETFNPGALAKVSVFKPSGEEVTVWEGDDPTLPGSDRGVSKISVQTDFPTRRVKLYLASPEVPGWNEIDAVALVDKQGYVQWASAAQASSSYASGRGSLTTASQPAELIPAWSSIRSPGEIDLTTAQSAHGTVLSAAFGWPFVAMFYESDTLPAVPPAVFRSGPAIFAPMTGTTPGLTTHRLPYRPVWTGLLLDTVICAFAAWLFYRIPLKLAARPLRVTRELMRLRRGQCLHCGYNLRYDFARGCPECGWGRENCAAQ